MPHHLTRWIRTTSCIALWCFAAFWGAVLLLLPTALSSETKQISVGRMMFCRSIKDREPQKAATSFPNDIEKVYCFTVILDAGAETHVVHKWYHKGKLRAEVKLKAKGEYWRTWSSKRMLPGWTGTWRVDIVSADGKILKSKSFELMTPGTEEAEPEEPDSKDEPDERSGDDDRAQEGKETEDAGVRE